MTIHSNLSCPKCNSMKMKRNSYADSGRQRYKCNDCGHQTVNPIGLELAEKALDTSKTAEVAKDCKRYDRFFITSAQNATPVFKNGLSSVHTYCKENSAKLLIIPSRYRNPTSVFTDKDHDWYDPEIEEFMTDKRFDICKGLTILADVKVQPTAAKPLTGMEGFTGTNSCIVASPKAQMRTIPTRQGDLAKIMQTTGSITIENYTDSKAGAKGRHHHIFGGIVVEVDRKKGIYHMRRVSINRDGSFYDLDKLYTGKKVYRNKKPEAVVLGDIHHWFIDKTVEKGIEERLLKKMKPKNIVIHDAVDSYSVSHHHAKMPFTNLAKHKAKMCNIKEEIDDFVSYAKNLVKKNKGSEFHVIPSNHHEHIQRWIEENDWKTDPENAEFYLETALHMVQNTKMTRSGAEFPDPFKHWINKLAPALNVLSRDDSLEISGFECGMHGHIGPNGARGSLQSLSKIGTKVIVGHVHSPGEQDGSLAVGVSAMDMEYADGPSSWLSSHAIVYPDGKATLVNLIDGEFTTQK